MLDTALTTYVIQQNKRSQNMQNNPHCVSNAVEIWWKILQNILHIIKILLQF